MRRSNTGLHPDAVENAKILGLYICCSISSGPILYSGPARNLSLLQETPVAERNGSTRMISGLSFDGGSSSSDNRRSIRCARKSAAASALDGVTYGRFGWTGIVCVSIALPLGAFLYWCPENRQADSRGSSAKMCGSQV